MFNAVFSRPKMIIFTRQKMDLTGVSGWAKRDTSSATQCRKLHMEYGFPQRSCLWNQLLAGDNRPLFKAGQPFTPYPHLWISLWIIETASGSDSPGIVKRFINIFNKLHKEASCG